jgi:glycogen(starch) synthase
MLTPHELTRDPRARRAAIAARDEGLGVVGLCAGGADGGARLDGIEVVRVGGGRASAAVRRAGLDGWRHSPSPLRELRGVWRLGRIAALTLRLVRAARRIGPIDVVHAHDVDTLPAGWLVARGAHARLVYDAHELYADQEPRTPAVYRAAITLMERFFASRADAVITVSEPIAAELRPRLRLRTEPIVVLSCPERREVGARARGNGVLRAVYQGAMGPGRSVEDLLVAAERAEQTDLAIRLVGADLSELREEVARRGLSPRVRVLDPVEPERLVEALLDFDVGVVINRPVTRNDELVFPNKLFEYLMAGLAVAVPRLPGMAPLVESEGIGVTYEPGRPDQLGEALTRLAADRDGLVEMRQRARKVALERLNAESQRAPLLAAWGISRTR